MVEILIQTYGGYILKKKVDKKEIIEKGNKTLSEFKEFISRGNVVDLSVGVE